jgi:hypothetical protein
LHELLRTGGTFFRVKNAVEIPAGNDRSAAVDERGTRALQDLPGEEAHERNVLMGLPLVSNPGQRHPDRQLNKAIIVAI